MTLNVKGDIIHIRLFSSISEFQISSCDFFFFFFVHRSEFFSFTAFSSMRFCTTSLTHENRKYKLVRHLWSREAPLLVWDFWVAAHVSFEQRTHFSKVWCTHSEVTVLDSSTACFQVSQPILRVRTKRPHYTYTASSTLLRYQATFQLWRDQLYISPRHILLKISQPKSQKVKM